MNLKKLIAIAILLPFLANGCVTLPKAPERRIEPDIVSGLWKKILEIVELKDASPMPKIILLKKNVYPKDTENCSRYHNKRDKIRCQEYNKNLSSQLLGHADIWNNQIRIYTKPIDSSFSWLRYIHNLWLNEEIEKINFYKTVAHEMLHHALYRKGVRDVLEHHRLMRDKKYLESAVLYLCQKFKLDPKLIIDKLKMADLEYSIQQDNLTKERNKREESVGKN